LNFTVAAGGRQVGSLTIEVGDGREQSLEVDTSSFANTAQDVVFSVSAQDPAYRQFCFDATAW
jgi:hypothetical protein